MTFFDLNFSFTWRHTSGLSRKEAVHEHRQDGFCATDGFYPHVRIQQMCKPLQRQLQGKNLFMLGPIPLHGIRTAYLPGRPAGHRGLPPCSPTKTVPYRNTGEGIEKHTCKCQSGKRLANIWRSCTGSHREGTEAVYARFLRDRAQPCRVCPGLDHDRSLPGPLSLGRIQEEEGCRKDTHTPRSQGQHPDCRGHYPRKDSRCEYPRSDRYRTGGILYCRPRVYGLCPASQGSSIRSVLCHTSKKQLPLQASVFSSCGQINGCSVRPGCHTGKLLRKKGISFKNKENTLLRYRTPETSGFSDQQLRLARKNHCRSVLLSVAHRALFQMDQATPQDKGILRHIRECGKDPDMDRYFCVCACGNHKKAFETGSKSLHNSTDFKRYPLRESAHLTGVLSC